MLSFMLLCALTTWTILVAAEGTFLSRPRDVSQSLRALRLGQGLPLQRFQGDYELAAPLMKRGVSTIGDVAFSHGSYFVTITIGKINLQVAIDTASADLWVISSDCSTPSCKNLPHYPLSFESTSFVSVNGNNTPFEVSYADGTSASGFVARENITLSNMTISQQAFALVNATDVTFSDRISGILGLGFSRLSKISQSIFQGASFITSIAQQGIAVYPLFGLYITGQSNGSITFGAVDASVVTNVSEILWHPVIPFSPAFNSSNSSIYLQWALELSNLTINNVALSPKPTYQNITHFSIAVFDVGTEGIFGPSQDVSRLFSLLDPESRLVGDGLYAVPCDLEATMIFSFGTQNIVLRPQDYIIGPTSGNPDLCLSWPQATGPSSDGIDWQLGTPFLRTVYSVYSTGIDVKEPPMIGLLQLNSTNITAISQTSETSATATPTFEPTTTIQTTLPNSVISLPTQQTPAYIFNTTAGVPTAGQLVSFNLATKTYSPILRPLNSTAIPTISPNVSLQTFVITDGSGVVHTETSTSVVQSPSVTLGVPPGFTSESRRGTSIGLEWTGYPLALLLALLLF